MIRILPALALLAIAAMPWRATGAEAAAPRKVETERITVPTKPVDPPGKAANAVAEPKLGKGATGLPPLVAKTRQAILDAAYSGDLGSLRAVMQRNETPPSLSVNEVGDPIDYLKSQSGDGEGLEVLAILTDVLEAGWALKGAGTAQEMYIWPAFAVLPLDKLSPGEKVELYKIVTSSDFDEMKNAGKYTFYSVGIGPDGTWHYFKLTD
ncbi:hypothetical protein ABB55_07265 [Prosthecomicrobium hirschii]|uniref:Uncharacterized protein n=1 Tax=Prosthecodimorpha hirschii TaxID=665126 RepID=A0A0P6VLG6_9HYPH|nr:hypothetical protein [Prosthecomicrobium hirschii]KPL52052.1 hypothetical protein ABB55_07265 [Prosthecomicrobium hirschii]